MLTLLLACSSSLDVTPGAGDFAADDKIYGGSAPDSVHHEAVVGLHQLTSSSVYVSPFCSGTLIAEDVVLTAAHCLDVAKGGKPKFQTMNPGQLAIYVGDDPSQDILQHLYVVSETLIHPNYSRNSLQNDIALVRLSSAVTESAPVANLPSSQAISNSDIGQDQNFAGFGQTETGSSGVKLQVDVPLGGLGCSVAGCPGSGNASTQVSYSQTSGDGTCFGDSGGPMFTDRAGTWYVSGITSYGDSSCTVYGVSTKVDAYESWISDFVGTSDTGGGGGGGGGGDTADTGTSSGSCGDGVCGTGESCDGRDGTLACAADCDGRTSGKKSNRYCYVEGSCEGGGCP